MSAATSETPKKFYGSSDSNSFACRLCLSVGDKNHRKRLFSAENADLLRQAEQLCGQELLESPDCRPCERRLKNTSAFRSLILQSQKTVHERGTRAKRCIGISPSAPNPAPKRADKKTAATSLDFDNIPNTEVFEI